VQQTIAWLEIPMDVTIGMQMIQSRRDIFEESHNLFPVHSARTTQILRLIELTFGTAAESFLELLGRYCMLRRVENVMMEIARIAVLLQDEGARHAWPKIGNLIILQPNMTVGHEVLVRQILEKLHFN
jgi:hypothetical protein